MTRFYTRSPVELQLHGWRPGVNIIKLRITVLRAFYLFFVKLKTNLFISRNLEDEKTEKKYKNTEKNMKIRRKSS